MTDPQEKCPEISDTTSKRISKIRDLVWQRSQVDDAALLNKLRIDDGFAAEQVYPNRSSFAYRGFFSRRDKVVIQWLHEKDLSECTFGKVFLGKNRINGQQNVLKVAGKRLLRVANIDYTKELIHWAKLAVVVI
jgi:hypothetical protein